MKKFDKLIDEFNNEKNIIVFTTYPPKNTVYNGHGGLSSFGKNFVRQLNKNKKIKIIVLTSSDKKKPYFYKENKKTLVLKLLLKNKFLFFYHSILPLFKLNHTKKVIFHFEFSSYGDLPTTIGIPFLFLVLKILEKETYLVLHQVETDLNRLYGHLGWKKNSLKAKFFNFFIKIYLFTLSFLSKKIIVLEEEFKKRLINLKINQKKIVVIPHPVDNNFIVEKNNSQKNNSLLYFGYLTWYKGIDWLVKNINGKTNLIIAGGESPTLKNKPHYKKFIKNVLENIENRKNIILTGFVPENQIKNYFQNTQISIFPYREFMSSSGPLSLTFSFEKPFLLSRPLEKYFESPDFAQALKETSLKKENLIFDLNKKSLEEKIFWARKNLQKLSQFSKIMKEKRSWEKVAKMYLEVINK